MKLFGTRILGILRVFEPNIQFLSIVSLDLHVIWPRPKAFSAQYPYRAVQIVLRLYQSPAEVLAGFDVDAPCCAYDG